MMRKLILVLVLTLCMAGAARADLYLEVVGDPTMSDSWFQRFNLNDIGGNEPKGFDQLMIRMVPGTGDFEVSDAMSDLVYSDPAHPLNFTSNGTSNLVQATGDNVAQLEFDLNFQGVPEMDVSFNLETFDSVGGAYVSSGHVWGAILGKNPGGQWKWDIAPVSVVLNDLGKPVFVPIPAAVLIGMLGLGVAGLKLRKYV